MKPKEVRCSPGLLGYQLWASTRFSIPDAKRWVLAELQRAMQEGYICGRVSYDEPPDDLMRFETDLGRPHHLSIRRKRAKITIHLD